jgi:hypothetical protein
MMFFVFAFSLITIAGYGLDHLLSGGSGKGAKEGADGRWFKVLAWGAGAVVLLALLLALGKSELPRVFAGILPEGVGQARLPSLLRHYPSIIQAGLVSGALALAILGLAWLWRTRRLAAGAFVALLAVLTFADLLRMDRHWINVVQPSEIYVRDSMIQRLQQDTSGARAFFYPTPRTNDYWDNSLLYFNVPTINSSMPLRLKWYEELMGTFTFNNLVQYPRLWDMLGAKYVLFRKSNLTPQFEQMFPFLQKQGEGQLMQTPVTFYANPNAWPRYRLYSRVEVLENDQAFVPRFNDQSFDYRNVLVLAEKPEFDPAALDSNPPEGAVSLDRYADDELALTVETRRPALLYLAETYHPYWRATLDGAPAKIYRANLSMRAVYVSPGRHELKMSYVCKPYIWGRRAGLMALLVLAAALVWTGYRKEW